MVERLRQHRLYILMFSLNLAVLIGVVYLLRRPEPRFVTITTPAPRVTPPVTNLQVEVSGAILQPGVYALILGSSVADALDAAGGPRPDADLGQLDLGVKLKNGDAIYVPARPATAKSDAPAPQVSPVGTAVKTPHLKIDINSATVEQLDTLPSIGPVLAQRIADYRTSVGPFKKIEDIKNVKGIGEAMFEDIKDLITVK